MRAFRIAGRLVEGLAALALVACASDPDKSACLGSGGSVEERIAACTRAIDSAALDSESLSDVYSKRADLLSEPGSYDAAIADYTQAIRLKPDSAYAYGWRGAAWNRKGEADRAIADFTEAIRRDPRHGWWHVFRGLRWVEKRDYDRAIPDFSEAIRVDPAATDSLLAAYQERGLAWRVKGQYDRAIADFGESIRVDPKLGYSFHDRGIAWALKGDYDRAIADYGEAIRLWPDDADPYRARAMAYRAQGKLDLAAADLREAGRLSLLPVRGRGVLSASFRSLYAAVERHEPLDVVGTYFSQDLLGRLGPAFGDEWLDQSVRSVPERAQMLERVEGSRGCLAYARRSGREAIELWQFSYAQAEGGWQIADAAYSISAYHNAVEAGPFCLTLGWPWK